MVKSLAFLLDPFKPSIKFDKMGFTMAMIKQRICFVTSPNDISELMNVLPNIDLTDVMEIPKEYETFSIFYILIKLTHLQFVILIFKEI